MRQQDLLYPYSFEERKPLLRDGVLFIPKRYEHQGLVSEKKAPLFVEFCSGNGEWIIEKAMRHPEVYWVAVEKKFDRVRKIWAKMKNRNIQNLLIVAGEAEAYAQFYLAPESVDQIFINFPDPWPKGRHAKHRLIQPPFIEQLRVCMKPGAGLTLVTDDLPYRNQMESVVGEYLQPEKCEGEGYGTSYFHRLWLEKGKEIHYLHFKR
jgi:tRNA (guanine-N7-)-methyltransferase